MNVSSSKYQIIYVVILAVNLKLVFSRKWSFRSKLNEETAVRVHEYSLYIAAVKADAQLQQLLPEPNVCGQIKYPKNGNSIESEIGEFPWTALIGFRDLSKIKFLKSLLRMLYRLITI